MINLQHTRLFAAKVASRPRCSQTDTIFLPENPGYLDHLLPASRGVRRIPDARLFFPEEFPDLLAEEARRLWEVG